MNSTKILLIILTSISILFLIATESNARSNKEYKILFLGDTSLNRHFYPVEGERDITALKGYDYSFKNFKQFLKRYDQIVLNLHGVMTSINEPPDGFEGKYKFKLDIDSTIKYLKKYHINLVQVAHNHILDFGLEGLKDNIRILKKNNLAFFGAGLTEEETTRPYTEEIELNGKKLKLILIGGNKYYPASWPEEKAELIKDTRYINYLSKENTGKQIKQARENNPDAIIIIFPHWGNMFKLKNEVDTELAHYFIDSGADIIIGHHSHLIQEIEKYNNDWILYDIGDFIFNVKHPYKSLEAPAYCNYSAMVEIDLSYNKEKLEKKLRIYPIVTDVSLTQYQPKFVNEDEFGDVYNFLKSKSNNVEGFKKEVSTGKDKYGYFMEIMM